MINSTNTSEDYTQFFESFQSESPRAAVIVNETMNYSYKRQNPFVGACVFFLSKKKFIEMAVIDGMAGNLESEDQQKRINETGEKLLRQWEEHYRSDYSKMTREINTALWSAFWIVVSVILLSLGFAFCLGSVNFSFPLDLVKFKTFLGSALVAWATLMELGGDFTVWDGKAFPQLAHAVIFKAIFVPGILLVLTSILI